MVSAAARTMAYRLRGNTHLAAGYQDSVLREDTGDRPRCRAGRDMQRT